MSPDASIGARAGLWRRAVALLIDSLVVSAVLQVIVAFLFAATSGRIQIGGDLTYTRCAIVGRLPEGLVPEPTAGTNVGRDCRVHFLFAQTARILEVGGGGEEEASRSYRLDRDGRPIEAVTLDWLALLALAVYLVAMEARYGATLGSRVMGIRVVDASASDKAGVPLRKALLRYAAMLIGLVPLLGVALIYFGLNGSLGEFVASLVSPGQRIELVGAHGPHAIHWRPLFVDYLAGLRDRLPDVPDAVGWLLDIVDALSIGWLIFLAVEIARKRDPLYDRLAGTAVLRLDAARSE
jgi:uncharacterized RDD family membrane protein YckC